MNKFSLYILLILIFLGLSKSFSPSEQKNDYIFSEQVFTQRFKDVPITIILTELFDAGLIIKTYYMKLKVINFFKFQVDEIIVRTNHNFWLKNKNHLGMSIFRLSTNEKMNKYLPLPPAAQFIGDSNYGYWVWDDSGRRVWEFHRIYRQFIKEFLWGDFVPDEDFLKQINVYLESEKPFFGPNLEFGTNGYITKKVIKEVVRENSKHDIKINFVDYIKKYFILPKLK